jgi:asparagine synthase (glutamine-hydrolysing)
MCGITGIVCWVDAGVGERLALMTGALAHRGPDDSGTVAADGVYLGHRRLTVIDLSANGHQPMSNEDGSVWITYNGELYGTEPLRAWLESRGHRFRSRTDTEVLVHLYEEQGPALFARINGMFAFAIHDRARRRLLLARDRLGIKPLFYAFVDGELLFGSEIKAILTGLGRRPSLRPDAIAQYLLDGFVSAPDTVFEGVRLLPAGHYLDVDLDALRDGRVPDPVEYWDAAFTGDDDRPVEEIERELESLLADAVKIRMVSDVPFGAFLSGGVDSSTVVALMAKASDDPVRTFTVDVPGTDRSEREKALAVARMYATEHAEIASVSSGADDYWPRLAHFDQPFNCASLLNAWLVCRAARERVTVALSGDGGDELFGGYARYAALAHRRSARRGHSLARGAARALPSDLRGWARVVEYGNDDFAQYFSSRHPIPVGVAEQLAGVSLASWHDRMRAVFERHTGDRVTRAMYFDAKTYLADHILAKVDSASMAVSLEVRVPLLDYRVVELAGRVPVSLKLRDGAGKWILKRLARRWLPEGFVDQKKMGFDPPLASWVFDAHQEDCLDTLARRDARFRDVLDGRVVDRWIRHLRDETPWRVPQRAGIWAIYQLEQWLDRAAGAGAAAPPAGPTEPLQVHPTT